VAAQQASGVTAIVNVNVIPMDAERLLENQTVIVQGDRIAALGLASTITIPEGAQIIDGEGRYLIPGLADMHLHIDEELTVLTLAIANGITTVQSLNTEPEHLLLAAEIEAGERSGPRIITGPHAVGLPPRMRFAFERVNRAAAPLFSLETYLRNVTDRSVQGFQLDAESARQFVHWASDAGGDFIKTNLSLSRETFDAIIETASELDMKVQGHVWGDIGLEHYIASWGQVHHSSEIAPYLSENGIQGVPTMKFDLLLVDERLPGLVALMKRHRMTLTPTVGVMWFVDQHFRDYQGVLDNPQLRYAAPELVRVLGNPDYNPVFENYGRDETSLEFTEAYQAFQARLVRDLHAAGVPLLAGTDALEVLGMVYGFALHKELQLFVEYGLTPYQALETATRNPAVFWDELAEWGTIAVGKRADLVLLQANPLEDISNTQRIEGVMLKGEWSPQAELQAMLEEIAATFEARAASMSLAPVE
jgi:predicted amidohydrolase YtcJ